MKSYKPHYTTCYWQQQTQNPRCETKGAPPKTPHSSHQRREDALGCTAGHGEAAVRAGVAGRQRLAEVVGGLLAHDPHPRGQVGVVLLLLLQHNPKPSELD